MKIKKVLFDLDGTMFDTQILHARVEAQLVRSFNMSISPEELSLRYAGRPTELVFQELTWCSPAVAKDLTKQKWDLLLPLAATSKPFCNLPELLSELQARNIAFAIGTASPFAWAQSLVKTHGLGQFFSKENIVSGDMVSKGKPDPEIWLRAAGDVYPSQCLVVEDGVAGIEGALAIHAPCALLLPRTHPAARPIANVYNVLEFV